MPEFDFRGGVISYEVSGQGPALIFLHGFLENRSIWNNYVRSLSSKYKVVSIDLPGHGSSSNFGYCHSMEVMAESVMAVLKLLDIRRFHLIGHSMGGYVSMAIAEKFADKIRGLCMFHSTADNDSEAKKAERLKVIKVVQRNKAVFISTSIPNLFNTQYKPYKREISGFVKSARELTSQGIIAALEGMRKRSNREIVLKFAPYPVLYIVGEKDNILDWKKLVNESKLTENGEYLLLENCGHMGFIEEREVCLQAIKDFLKRKA